MSDRNCGVGVATDRAAVGAGLDGHEPARWRIQWKLRKWFDADTAEQAVGVRPDEVTEYEESTVDDRGGRPRGPWPHSGDSSSASATA